MNQTIDTMMALLRFELCGTALDEATKQMLSSAAASDLLRKVYALSGRHDLTHLVADALFRNGVLAEQDELSAKFQKQHHMAVYRVTQMEYELSELYRVLEEATISFIPLKGSVLRRYYPEPWMRTSCDIDMLVQEKDLQKATEALSTALTYRVEKTSPHDISLFSPGGVHLELHYGTVEEGRANRANAILSGIWETATSIDGSYQYAMSDEMFYFYHIAHMAKHFEIGGCGIRPFLDLWILNHKIAHDPQKRKALLEEGGLETFAQAAQRLSEVWLSGKDADELSLALQTYIVDGGVYGSTQNRMNVQQNRKGGKINYLLFRFFIPYDKLKFYYPVLQKHKWLLPFMWVRRWCRLIFGGSLKRSVNEIKDIHRLSDSQQQQISDLLLKLGL